jgi:hypothetical protein
VLSLPTRPCLDWLRGLARLVVKLWVGFLMNFPWQDDAMDDGRDEKAAGDLG